jgi:hypothetical protein
MKSKIISVLSSIGAFVVSCFGGACGPACFLSGCCGGTFILGFLGLSSSSIRILNKLTPLFLAFTILSLGYAFYIAYKPKQKKCCESNVDSQNCCTIKEKTTFFKSKTFLWLITVICFIMWTYPLINNNKPIKDKSELSCPEIKDSMSTSCCPSANDKTLEKNNIEIKKKNCCPPIKK